MVLAYGIQGVHTLNALGDPLCNTDDHVISGAFHGPRDMITCIKCIHLLVK